MATVVLGELKRLVDTTVNGVSALVRIAAALEALAKQTPLITLDGVATQDQLHVLAEAQDLGKGKCQDQALWAILTGPELETYLEKSGLSALKSGDGLSVAALKCFAATEFFHEGCVSGMGEARFNLLTLWVSSL